jgi:plasmid stabilization system protein ParE
MPRYKLKILAPAWIEIEEIAEYHLLVVGQISAKKITDRILSALERLEEFPLSCPYVTDAELKSQDYRMLVCDKYVCIYRLIADTVFVYHIAHGATEYSKLF